VATSAGYKQNYISAVVLFRGGVGWFRISSAESVQQSEFCDYMKDYFSIKTGSAARSCVHWK
jgi:hypothetical protein